MNTIVSQFNIQGNVVEVAPLGNGLINTTYRVKTEVEVNLIASL